MDNEHRHRLYRLLGFITHEARDAANAFRHWRIMSDRWLDEVGRAGAEDYVAAFWRADRGRHPGWRLLTATGRAIQAGLPAHTVCDDLEGHEADVAHALGRLTRDVVDRTGQALVSGLSSGSANRIYLRPNLDRMVCDLIDLERARATCRAARAVRYRAVRSTHEYTEMMQFRLQADLDLEQSRRNLDRAVNELHAFIQAVGVGAFDVSPVTLGRLNTARLETIALAYSTAPLNGLLAGVLEGLDPIEVQVGLARTRALASGTVFGDGENPPVCGGIIADWLFDQDRLPEVEAVLRLRPEQTRCPTFDRDARARAEDAWNNPGAYSGWF